MFVQAQRIPKGAAMSVRTLLSDVDGTLVRTLKMVRLAQWETVSIILRKYGAGDRVPRTLEDFMLALSPFFGKGPHTELMGAISALTRSTPGLVLKVDPNKAVELLHKVEA